MLRPVPEGADMDTQLGPAGRYVDPVFQHNQRHYVGFVRDLVEAGSVGFVEDAVEHVRLLFVAKKVGAQRFVVDARASNRHFSRPQSGSNCRERLRTDSDEHGVLVKWCHSFLVAITWKNIVGDRKSAVFLCTTRVGWQSRPLQRKKKASFVEVAVAPHLLRTACT